jgi:hypothetical protein
LTGHDVFSCEENMTVGVDHLLCFCGLKSSLSG